MEFSIGPVFPKLPLQLLTSKGNGRKINFQPSLTLQFSHSFNKNTSLNYGNKVLEHSTLFWAGCSKSVF